MMKFKGLQLWFSNDPRIIKIFICSRESHCSQLGKKKFYHKTGVKKVTILKPFQLTDKA